MIDRRELKSKAKMLCKTGTPSLITMGFIYTLISALMSALSSAALNGGIPKQLYDRFMYLYTSGDFEKALTVAAQIRPSTGGSLIHALITVAMWVVAAGFVIFIMNSVRNMNAAYGNILDGFGITLRVILLNLLETIIVGLFSCLLVVPGIIFSYAYRQAMYLMIDHPELSVKACLKESRLIMKGHKWELFVLDLSMLGWLILNAILPVAGIYVSPFSQTVYFMYYQKLIGESTDEIPNPFYSPEL